MRSLSQRTWNWLDERLNLDELIAHAKEKTVPIHKHTLWYYLGGMTAFLFFVQVVTGILLLLYYRPSSDNAFESVQFIMTEVHFGWLVRSVHSWGANLMIAAAFAHMFSVYFLRAYRKPRELTWVTGILFLFIALTFGFSGYLLPWNELSFFATKVGTEIAGVIPLVGHFLKRFLRGGEDVTGATLTRFFGWHVAMLPAAAAMLLMAHLFMVQRLGMSSPEESTDGADNPSHGKTMLFFPNFLLRDLVGWLIALGILGALAAIYPWELGVKADPFASAPANIKPEWYFVFMFQTLKILPAKILFMDGEVLGILAFGLAGLVGLLVPFLDTQSGPNRTSLIFTVLGVVALVYMVAMTVIAYI
ncbi:MAG: cytochrome bc complex cytochrome b subunit [Acidobacteria bacterium]|nr:cytochrome bc complex cytochrome b subunit [Acidobacteriota bacterium]MBI3655611.1 cytochrome bc complex cytochrome b subunit [Acidobacteriota bacterium]